MPYWYGAGKSTEGKAVIKVTKAILEILFVCGDQAGHIG